MTATASVRLGAVSWSVPLLLSLLACKDKDPEPVVAIESDSIVLRLVNPTDEDPFVGVSSLRLEVAAGGEVVASSEFELGDSPELGDLAAYGAVRFRLAGLSGTSVLSYGRSSEVVLYPGVDRSVPILFLPVNEVLPITSDEMAADRSEHLATRLRDGRLLLVGGRAPDGFAAYADLEIYDPELLEFQSLGDSLPQGTAGLEGAWTEDYTELIITGGTTLGAGAEPSAATVSVDAESLQVDIVDDMTTERSGHCFTIFKDTSGIALGGNSDVPQGDYLKVDANSGIWVWEELDLDDLDESQVTGCATAESGKVFVQGLDSDSTGVFDYTNLARVQGVDIEEAFSPLGSDDDFLPLQGAMLIPVPGNAVWVGGGMVRDESGLTASPNEEGQLFLLDSETFVTAADPEVTRVNGSWDHWIEEGWAVLGCGSADGTAVNIQTRVELVDLKTGDRLSTDVVMDRQRADCKVTTMLDGSVLITGGFSATQVGQSTAAVLIPYLGD